ncbi:MAG TPA: dienelactone hydrolase family protein [Alphaproteobacteria bacterium]|nr:dienelactone hydrolase family protein [Alphaproteobacteria bacterium]
MLKDYRIPPLAGGKPERAVIFLHGVGDSGQGGLLSIGQMWQAALPRCEFLCPDAPFPFDMAPPDMDDGRQWFSLKSFAMPDMLAGAKTAAPLLDAYIDHVLATRGLAPKQLALVGFSQGTIMALYVAPRRTEAVAGIIGYSGLLVGGETLLAEKKSAPPALLVHGRMDEVVPYNMLELSERGLRMAGIPATSLTCPLTGHSIDDAGIAEGLKFLTKILA